MSFGPPIINPPYFYFFFLPADPIPSNSVVQSIPIPLSLQSVLEEDERIIVREEDLIAEGYEQTKRAWTEEQDSMLRRLCSSHKNNFEQVAKMMPHRNAKMCYSRYRRLTNQSKNPWSNAQNQRLKALVENYGEDNWRSFEEHFPNRNHKQLKDHYQNYLRPDISHQEWTLQEDLKLISLLNQHGKNWKLFEQLMPHRSRNQLKNRYFGKIIRINAKKIEKQRSIVSEVSISPNKLSLLPL